MTYNREAFPAAAASMRTCCNLHPTTFTSLSQSAKDLLAGVVPPKRQAGNDQFLLKNCVLYDLDSVLQSETINTILSDEDVKRGFQGWWGTSNTTSPSGRHLGQCTTKALITHPTFLHCLTKFLVMITLFHGILVALPQWCNATNIFWRTINIGLRIIHLFEVDFNFLLKILWGSSEEFS